MERKSEVIRTTKETDIRIKVNLDSKDKALIHCENAFFVHMLELFSKHSGIFIEADIKGDSDIDMHHTIEDTGIVLGEALLKAIDEKKGINRYGFMILPMDEALVRVALDLSGRFYFRYDAGDLKGHIGDFDMDHVKHFFRSISENLKCNLHMDVLAGDDKHHITEALFKGFAHAFKMAIKKDGSEILSTKGQL